MALDKEYWENRYLQKDTGWDLGQVSPPIKAYIDQLDNKEISILIPGCGNAYEANYLLEKGFSNITLVDVSPTLVEQLKFNLNANQYQNLKVICGDFFSLHGKFDLIIEQTFFCALHPSLRKYYCTKMSELLAPTGKLVGLLFNRNFENNPPFGGSTHEYEELFSTCFQIQKMEPCYNSIAPRQGSELFVSFTNRFAE
jgi:hypothetical protein